MPAQLTVAEGERLFRERTSRDARDPFLSLLVAHLAAGLDAEARGDRSALVEDPELGVRAKAPPKRRGRRPISPRLAHAVRLLVRELGPADAALLCMLHGLDASKAWPSATVGRDLSVTWRRAAQRLHDVAAQPLASA